MKYTTLPTTDVRVSKICLGTMTWGEQNTEEEAHDQLDFAQDQGINFLDTAEVYPVPAKEETQGRTESYIGNYFAHKGDRSRWVIATKAMGPSSVRTWIRGGTGLTKEGILEAIEGSLKRLQTDYIDLYQLHWPQRQTNVFGSVYFQPQWAQEEDHIHEVLQALSQIVQQGKVRYVGLSNETAWGVSRFLRLAEEHNLPRVVTLQNAYNLACRTFDVHLSEVCLREHVGLLPYSPLGGGLLSGKYRGNQFPAKARYSLPEFVKAVSRFQSPHALEAVEFYCALAERYGLSPATMANAFVNGRPYVVSTIIGATSLPQLEENVRSVDVTLSEEILKEIEDYAQANPNPVAS